jgi:hypothetical protein
MSRYHLKNAHPQPGLEYHCSFSNINEGKAHVKALIMGGIAAHYGINNIGIHIYTEG